MADAGVEKCIRTASTPAVCIDSGDSNRLTNITSNCSDGDICDSSVTLNSFANDSIVCSGSCVGNSSSTCCTDSQCTAGSSCLGYFCKSTLNNKKMIIKNSTKGNVAFFDNLGNVVLKGGLTQNCLTNPTSNAFIITNQSGSSVAWINSSGSMCIDGTLAENGVKSLNCNNAFMIRNSSGANVACIYRSNGNLSLVGYLGQYGSP